MTENDLSTYHYSCKLLFQVFVAKPSLSLLGCQLRRKDNVKREDGAHGERVLRLKL